MNYRKNIFLFIAICLGFSAMANEDPTVIAITADGTHSYKLSQVQKITFHVDGSASDGMVLDNTAEPDLTAISCIKFGTTTAIATTAVQTIYVFPNPVSEYLTISGMEDGTQGQIVNDRGVVVLSQNSTRIDVANLAQGTYFLVVKNQTLRFIKK